MSKNPKKANVKNAEKKQATNGKKKKKRSIKKIILITILVLFLLCIIAAGVLVGIFFGMFGDELKIEKKDLIVGATNSKVIDKDGELLAVIAGDEKRQVISIDEMPEYLPKAYVAIEDERFEQHHGVDIKRTAGAIVTYVLNGGKSGFGGSTITQQLVKNITEEDDRGGIEGVIRKVKEWARAYNVEKMLSKTQILELYLNILFVGGPELHGVELGAKYYFDKTAKDLSLAESAFMAGINSSPNAYNAFSTDEDMVKKIKTKTKVVLNKMKELGSIPNEDDYNKAIEEVDNGLAFKKGNITTTNLSYHTEAAINEVIKDYMEEKGCTKDLAEIYIYSSGLTIQTTQDTSIQKRVEEEYNKDKWIAKSKKNKDKDGNWKTTQSAMVIIDHKTGYVLGTVGGLGEKTTFGLNRATQSTRQTGSAMKPLAAIAPALEAGKITAGTVYDDVATTFGSWTPKNYYGYYKGLSTVRYAIEISQNIVPAKISSEVGIKNSIEFMEKAGITTLVTASKNKEHNDEGLPLALGGLTNGVSPLEMAGAYAMIANDGVYIEPTFYTKVEDSEGNTVLESNQESRRVMTEGNSYILKSILKEPVIGNDSLATARKCAISGMDVAAKTGTTSDDFDRWLCGFTPYYTAAIWFGFDDNETIPTIPGSGSANPGSYIFKSIMTDIHKDLKNASFVAPKNIVRATICSSSGLLATEDCKNAINGNCSYSEVFVAGTQPKKSCTTHVKAKVCEIGKDQYALSNEWCTDSKEIVFITRENSEKTTTWKRARDAKYMLPTEQCAIHKKPEELPPIDNSTSNNTTDNTTGNTVDNSIGNNTTENTVDNSTGNNVTNNTVNNAITNNTIDNIINSVTNVTNTVN